MRVSSGAQVSPGTDSPESLCCPGLSSVLTLTSADLGLVLMLSLGIKLSLLFCSVSLSTAYFGIFKKSTST